MDLPQIAINNIVGIQIVHVILNKCSKKEHCGFPERDCCGDAFVSSIAAVSSTEMG